jgi:SanA protein
MRKVVRWTLIILLSLCILTVGVFLLVNVSTHKLIYDEPKDAPEAQVAVILGAAILYNGNISPVLRDRSDTAIELYEIGKAEKILVTGDNSSLAHNEVNPVRKYLLSKGIPDEDIFLDHAGFDTYSSMYRARDIFLTDSIIVVTQTFHLPRAIFIAKNLGMEVYGVSADHRRYKFRNYTRELLANVKAVMNLVFKREPKYLGEPIPITEDSGLNNREYE